MITVLKIPLVGSSFTAISWVSPDFFCPVKFRFGFSFWVVKFFTLLLIVCFLNDVVVNVDVVVDVVVVKFDDFVVVVAVVVAVVDDWVVFNLVFVSVLFFGFLFVWKNKGLNFTRLWFYGKQKLGCSQSYVNYFELFIMLPIHEI